MVDRNGLWVATCLVLLVTAAGAGAEPMKLHDTTPRQVLVQFENSPSDRPELLDGRYSLPFPAWLERDGNGNTIVRIPGDVLERSVFSSRRPVPGSFSDYVWVFDSDTGDVLSASFSGVLRHRLDLGLAKPDIEARVHATMTTTAAGGFTPPRVLFGRRLNRFCSEHGSKRCTLVPPQAYDPERGYVNAVGALRIDSSFTDFETFSALGEARFTELVERAHVGSGDVAGDWNAAPADFAATGGSALAGIDVSAPPPRD